VQLLFAPPMLFVVLVLLAAAVTVLWVAAVVSVATTQTRTWAYAGHSQVAWLLVVIFLGWLGALLYWIIARPTLLVAAQRG
jgi:hypothetical protein